MSVRPPDSAEIFAQIRTNWAFEHLIVSVLAGAGVAGALTFAFALGGLLLASVSIGASIAAAFVKALLVAFFVFLVGFLSGVLIIAPLFRSLEKAKRRSVWPYIAASLVISVAALTLVANMRGASSVGVSVSIPVIASSVIIAWFFARRMTPLWRAAEKAESKVAIDDKRLN